MILKRPYPSGTEHQPIESSAFDHKSDLDLWRTFKEGDDGAFVYIYRVYINLLFTLGLQFTKNEALIKDCLQDFFIELREKRYNLGDTDNIKLYLFKSFRRRIIAYLKKESRFVSGNFLKNSFAIEFAADEKLINQQFSEHRLKQLKSAMEKLPAKEREIIYFFFYENLSYREIAEILNYTHVASARRSVYKALKKIRKFMIGLLLLVLSLDHLV